MKRTVDRTARLALALMLFCALPAAAQMPDFTRLVREAAPVVVNISAAPQLVYPDLPLDEDGFDAGREYLWRYFGPVPEQRSLGSGFLIGSDGYIITNAHLVSGAGGESITVHLADRREFEARLIGADSVSDIALIKIEGSGLPRAHIGDPARLEVGQWVAAIGSPFGFERSVTAGIVSALERTLPEEILVPFIQSDVAINPGNSGGPLLNLDGEVVGVNSLIYTETGGYMGVSFAVPIDVAMGVAAELRAHGRVTRGRIGVRLQELSLGLARALNLPRASGALIVEAFRRGPAERAGMRSGDVVVRFAGRPVETGADLARLAARAAPGSTVEVEFLRDGAARRAQVGVDAVPAAGSAVARGAENAAEASGLQLAPLTPRQREHLGVEGGLLVQRAGGAGQRAGLLPGDVILAVNGKPVPTPQVFRQLLAAAGDGATVALLVQRNRSRQFMALQIRG